MSRATWGGVTWEPSNLARGESQKIACYWDEFVQYTAPPGLRFTWSEWQMPEHLKHWCRANDMISQVAPEQWVTDPKLWAHLINRASPGEEIGGETVGQEQLPIDEDERDRSTRVLAAERRRAQRGGQQCRQAMLTGDAVKPVNEDGDNELIVRNKAQGNSSPSRAGKAAADDAQATLTESVQERGDWAGITARPRMTLTRRESGRVYTGQVPLIMG